MNKNSILALTAISIIFGLVPVIAYFFYFTGIININNYELLKLPFVNETWGNFGSYLSGTSGSVFSFFSLVAVIYSLNLTQKMSLSQLHLTRSDQLTSEFNLLLDTLTKLLEQKEYPDLFDKKCSFETFKDYIYAKICLESQRHPTTKDNLDFAYVSVLTDNALSNEYINIFKKECDIYTVLLQRILLAPTSLSEAFIAILYAKINEDYLFFLNSRQLTGNLDVKTERLKFSGVSLTVPEKLMSTISPYMKD